ncbi:MAG: hypothetical protein JO032_06635 [Alphaproteobacteria bacterium]|nr:hypothetical protein [Alphaproteobacteria bacterium]
MTRSVIAGAALAMVVGPGGLAQAQTAAPVPPLATPVPPAVVDPHGPDLIIGGNEDPALHYVGDGILVYDLRGGKMINCQTAGAPAAGSIGQKLSHPCR